MDLNHYYGGDIAVSPSGDLAIASPTLSGTQRIYRRLLTNPQLLDNAGNVVAAGDYFTHPTYGAGLGRMVGSPQASAATAALIIGQMKLEQAVQQNPPPVVTLTPILNGLNAAISYVNTSTSTPQIINFDITK